MFPGVPLLALTASASSRCRDDIVRKLNFNQNQLSFFLDSFNRKNLSLIVKQKTMQLCKSNSKEYIEDIIDTIHTCLQQDFMKNNQHMSMSNASHRSNNLAQMARRATQEGSVILYCLSKKECEDVSKLLNQHNMKSKPYHGGLSMDVRRKTQDDWTNNKLQVVVGTTAFGMGINKPDVRFVGHLVMPSSIARYYQEIGRAGRDGKYASCVCWFSEKDYSRNQALTGEADNASGNKGFGGGFESINPEGLQRCKEYLTNNKQCRRKALLEFFGENFDARQCRGTCDVCENLKAMGKSLQEANMSRMDLRQQREDLLSGRMQDTSGNHDIQDFTWLGKKLIEYVNDTSTAGVPWTVARLRDAMVGCPNIIAMPKKKRMRKKRKGAKNNSYDPAVNSDAARFNPVIESHKFYNSHPNSWGGKKDSSKKVIKAVIDRMVELKIFRVEMVGGSVDDNNGRGGKKRGRWGRRRKMIQWSRLLMGECGNQFLREQGLTRGGSSSSMSNQNNRIVINVDVAGVEASPTGSGEEGSGNQDPNEDDEEGSDDDEDDDDDDEDISTSNTGMSSGFSSGMNNNTNFGGGSSSSANNNNNFNRSNSNNTNFRSNNNNFSNMARELSSSFAAGNPFFTGSAVSGGALQGNQQQGMGMQQQNSVNSSSGSPKERGPGTNATNIIKKGINPIRNHAANLNSGAAGSDKPKLGWGDGGTSLFDSIPSCGSTSAGIRQNISRNPNQNLSMNRNNSGASGHNSGSVLSKLAKQTQARQASTISNNVSVDMDGNITVPQQQQQRPPPLQQPPQQQRQPSVSNNKPSNALSELLAASRSSGNNSSSGAGNPQHIPLPGDPLPPPRTTGPAGGNSFQNFGSGVLGSSGNSGQQGGQRAADARNPFAAQKAKNLQQNQGRR